MRMPELALRLEFPQGCGDGSGSLRILEEQSLCANRGERSILPEGPSSVKAHGTILKSKKAG